ncbi:MAG: sensor histidine kinase KdpD [Chloroflexi bacterium]|nr:sensor histidine kinase KdpD [Chloroflexota bacterium]
MRQSRPSPDQLLARIKSEEQQQNQGKLTIFLGFAAGVGKTYAMLEDAQQQKDQAGLVVAYVETHGRVETERLLGGLEILPRKQIEYRGILIPEMDLDAVLARKPRLALVDELAHTNAPGSRHPKRYQDVEELLKAGIDVYTTLNIQHLESVRNTVAQITSVWVRETVPDSIIDKAGEIKLVDLPPDELILRLKEGKVYVPEMIAHATRDFFRKGNLSALREIALRIAAEHVERATQVYMQTQAIQGPWAAAEHLLVCIDSGPLANRVVRSARRLASQLNAEWSAVHVETPDNIRLSSAQRERLAHTMQLAKRLGADVQELQGQSVADTVIDYAKAHNITKIVVGKPLKSRWQEMLRSSVSAQIIRKSSYFDIHVIGGKGESIGQDRESDSKPSVNWRGYLISVGLVIIATLIGVLLQPLVHPANLIMIYLLCVVIAAVFFGFGPSIVVCILGVLAFDFFFIPPVLSFAVADMQYLFTFSVLLIVGIVISYLTARIRKQGEAARQRQVAISTLYALSREMTAALNVEDTVNTVVNYVKRTLGLDAVILLPDPENDGKLIHPFQKINFSLDENDVATAFWAYEHQQATGRNTDTLPDARALYLPLHATRRAIGVMGIWLADRAYQMPIQQIRLLEALGDLAAVAIERAQLAETMQSTST